MRKGVFIAGALVLSIAALLAQGSPRDAVMAEVGGKTIIIDYGRPSLEGRSVDELLAQLPADRIWRAGADQVTTLIAEGAFKVGNTVLPAGRYSVYLHCPEEGPYSLVLNKVVGQPLGEVWSAAPAHLAEEPFPHFQYENEIGDQEAAREPMRSETVTGLIDPFTITLTPAGNGATLRLAWGTQAWSLNLMPAS